MSNTIELDRKVKSGGISAVIKGCTVDIVPPDGKKLTINELCEVLEEIKRFALRTHSL